jgi:hypothetical protein
MLREQNRKFPREARMSYAATLTKNMRHSGYGLARPNCLQPKSESRALSGGIGQPNVCII